MPEFPTTRWTLVMALNSADAEQGRAAMASICDAYWYPLYAYARRHGRSHDSAADVTQAFFLHLLEHAGLQRADPARGRLRSYLLRSFRNFLVNTHEHAGAQKRGGHWRRVDWDPELVERRYAEGRPDRYDPERLYSRQWALTVIARALESLRARRSPGMTSQEFERLVPLLTGDGDPSSYKEIAAVFGKSEGALRVDVHRLRKRFAAALREEVAATVESEAETEDEVRALLVALTE